MHHKTLKTIVESGQPLKCASGVQQRLAAEVNASKQIEKLSKAAGMHANSSAFGVQG